MSNKNGWISIHRKILDWEWFDDHNTFRLFIFLLLSANYEQALFKGIVVERGQLITSRRTSHLKVGLTEREFRTSLEHLVLSHQVTLKTSHYFTIITICKYDEYQEKTSHQTSHQTPSYRPTKRPQYNKYNKNNKFNKPTAFEKNLKGTPLEQYQLSKYKSLKNTNNE